MADETYSVKINRRDGIVEITGSDKEWIAAQLDRLSAVYSGPLGDRGARTDEFASTGEDILTPSAKTPRKRRPKRTAASEKGSELDAKLTKEARDEMHAYFAQRPSVKSHQARVAVIASFVLDELQHDSIDGQDVITVYRAMGWQPPKNPTAAIQNAMDRNGYFGGWRDGRVQLTPTGEHFGRHGSMEAAAK